MTNELIVMLNGKAVFESVRDAWDTGYAYLGGANPYDETKPQHHAAWQAGVDEKLSEITS